MTRSSRHCLIALSLLAAISSDGKALSLGHVWGAPIRVTRQAEPTAAYIAEVHAAFVGEVRRIFDTYKSRFGYADGETLELVSAKSAKTT